MNALASDKVADFINEHFVATFMKVGTFRIVNGQKLGGNVASYFCLPDGAVVHALAGKTDAETLLSEARWAYETRKYALTRSTKLASGITDATRFRQLIRAAHEERLALEVNPGLATNRKTRPQLGRTYKYRPTNLSTPAQTHWYLATQPLAPVDQVFPYIWEEILHERLSGVPVAQR